MIWCVLLGIGIGLAPSAWLARKLAEVARHRDSAIAECGLWFASQETMLQNPEVYERKRIERFVAGMK
jgi:hypothetical protein